MEDRVLVIDVVDNGGQWTHREGMLRYLKVDTQIIENTTPVSELRALDGRSSRRRSPHWAQRRVGQLRRVPRRPRPRHLCRSSIHGAPLRWRRP